MKHLKNFNETFISKRDTFGSEKVELNVRNLIEHIFLNNNTIFSKYSESIQIDENDIEELFYDLTDNNYVSWQLNPKYNSLNHGLMLYDLTIKVIDDFTRHNDANIIDYENYDDFLKVHNYINKTIKRLNKLFSNKGYFITNFNFRTFKISITYMSSIKKHILNSTDKIIATEKKLTDLCERIIHDVINFEKQNNTEVYNISISNIKGGFKITPNYENSPNKSIATYYYDDTYKYNDKWFID